MVSSSVYIAVNHVISEQQTAMDVEESHVLTGCTILTSAWIDYGTLRKYLSGQLVSTPRIKLGPFQIQVTSTTL